MKKYIALLLSFSTFAWADNSQLEKAWKAYLAGDQLSAQQLLQSLEDKDSSSAKLLNKLTDPKQRQKFLDQLTETYEKLLAQNHLDQSLESAKFILTIDPKNEVVAESYIKSLLKLQRPFKAYSFCQTFLGGKTEGLPEKWKLLLDDLRFEAEAKKDSIILEVDKLLLENKVDESLTRLEQAHIAFSNNYDLIARITLCFALQSKQSHAIQTFEKALKLDFERARHLSQHDIIRLRLLPQKNFQKSITKSFGKDFLQKLKSESLDINGHKFRFIPAGLFSREDGAIQIQKAFWMSEAELTTTDFEKMMTLPEQKLGSDPANKILDFKALPPIDIAIQEDYQEEAEEPTKPVVNVSWNDAVKYCQKLSESSPHSFRLPTEEEWEYACRGNSTFDYSFGDKASVDKANFTFLLRYGNDTRPSEIKVGGTYPKNLFGLYDMHGNVAEWTASAWRPLVYAETNQKTKPAKLGDKVVLKGGSYLQDQEGIKASARLSLDSYSAKMWVGFRLIVE